MLPFPNIDPVAFHIGPLAVRWYGISYLVGITLGWWLMRRRARAPDAGWTVAEVGDFIFYLALGAVLGGRIGYILFYNFDVYLRDPLAIFRVWQGGMSFHGGLIGLFIASGWWARKTRRGFLQVCDFVVPAGPPGLFFGRLANFINGELWGAPTQLPWGVVFPNGGPMPRHPSQLYEAALEGVVLFAMIWWYSGRPRPRGSVTGLFLIGYGAARSLVEFVREPDAQIGYLAGNWLTMGQVLSVPMIALGIWLMLRGSRYGPRGASR
ncbi:MAG: Prolipoprotein diacylglyceryl transferase [Gammaproteobacteria bacterium]|nr:Prolipoprotein diacylglyceryl transferase [Gammaproteobacteria bacterium]